MMWQDCAVTNVVQLAPLRDADPGTGRIGPFALRRFVAAPTRCREVARLVEADARDNWALCIASRVVRGRCAGGVGETVPAGVPLILPLGDLRLLDELFAGRQYAASVLCLFIPRDAFPELSPAIGRCCRRPLVSAPGRLLANFLDRLAAELSRMREAEIPRAVEATRALVTATVASCDPAGAVNKEHVQAARLSQIQAIIRQHLRAPELTPEWLCRLAGVSRSQLYRLFEPLGGIAREIHRERLREARRAIADPDDRRTIREIGEELGFVEPTTFSRAFRREFGCSPSELRQAVPRPR